MVKQYIIIETAVEVPDAELKALRLATPEALVATARQQGAKVHTVIGDVSRNKLIPLLEEANTQKAKELELLEQQAARPVVEADMAQAEQAVANTLPSE
jgi:hypothetical protein